MIPDEDYASRGFPKKEHLQKTADFRRVYKSGRSFKSEPFVLKALPNTLNFSRIGFSISSRNIKKASVRNRVRRLFREAFRKNKGAFKKDFDMVLIVRKEPQNKFSYKDAENTFLKMAKKTGAAV